MPDEKRQIDPTPLSPEYHKAHKQLMLWAAILFIWELVGIDLDRAKEAGGNVGAIVSAIKSPQAVPWVLMILVAYFLFKTTVEWYQCSSARRSLRVAKIDFAAAWIVPLTAYALSSYQRISSGSGCPSGGKTNPLLGLYRFFRRIRVHNVCFDGHKEGALQTQTTC